MSRPLAAYAQDWEANARADAAYAVLSDPSRRNAGWDGDAFLAAGEDEIAIMWAELVVRRLLPDRPRLALDFGCGLGRLTLALARRCERAVGVDVSPTMVAEAERRHATRTDVRLAFVVNARPDLALQPSRSVDVVYSNIVLQHLPPPLQRGYLAELVRVLAPGGVAAIQVPSFRRGLRGALRRHVPEPLVPLARRVVRPPAILREGPRPIAMEMHCLRSSEVASVVAAAGGEIVDVLHTNATRPDFNGRLLVWSAEQAWTEAEGGGYLSPHYLIRRVG